MSGVSNFISRNRLQTAVYWGAPTPDGYGAKTFDAPVEIAVRWEERTELFTDAAGEEQQSKAVVYPAVAVDRGGYLYLGELADLNSQEQGDPYQVQDAHEIKETRAVPRLRDPDTKQRKAWL